MSARSDQRGQIRRASLTLNGLDGPLTVEGGGTNSTSASAARTALQLGSMSTQSSTGVSITGGSISGTTGLESGTYSPTLEALTNVSTYTAYACQWMRVHGTVTVSGQLDIDPTSTGQTILGISLPVTSNIGNAYECAGTAVAPAINGQAGAIYGDSTGDRARLEWETTDTSNRAMYFSFTYKVST